MDSEQKVIANIKLTILHEQRDLLAANVNPDRHMDFLRSRYILSEDDCDEISAQITRRKRASKFLDILLRKGADAYDAFRKALEIDGTQTFLLEILNVDYERRINNYRALFKPPQPVIRIITPPAICPPPPPPPPPDFLPLKSVSLEPVEHQYAKTPTPPVSPDLTEIASTSGSSSPTVFTNLSSETKESIQKQENSGQFDTVGYMKSLCSTSSNPTMASLNDRMQDFSLTSSSSSVFSSSSCSSILNGVTESEKSSPHHTRLCSRGSADDDTDPSSTTQPGRQLALVDRPSGCADQDINQSTVGNRLRTTVDTIKEGGEQSSEFFSSLPQSWVDTSTDSRTSSESQRDLKRGLQTHADNEYHPKEAKSLQRQSCLTEEESPADGSLSPKEQNDSTIPKTLFESAPQDGHLESPDSALCTESSERESGKTQTDPPENEAQPDDSQQTKNASGPNLGSESDGTVHIRLSSYPQGKSQTVSSKVVVSASFTATGTRTSSHC